MGEERSQPNEPTDAIQFTLPEGWPPFKTHPWAAKRIEVASAANMRRRDLIIDKLDLGRPIGAPKGKPQADE